MFGSAILEVAIGVVFIFALVAIICSAIREGIESVLKSRAAQLEYGIRQLLHDEPGTGLVKSFYNHPLIYSLYPRQYTGAASTGKPGTFARGHDLPSYIPARNFALALMDIAARGPRTDAHSSHGDTPPLSIESVRSNVLNIGNPSVQRALLTALDSAQGNFERAVTNVQAWYDSGMDRVSGWYKRATQRILFGIGLAVAIALNINTITLVEYLYRDDAARAALVARAEAAAADTTFRNQANYTTARAALDSLSLPIGWENGLGTTTGAVRTAGDWWWYFVFAPVFGWLLTAFAAAMGAPFWFDLLNKVMVIRSTVKPHEKSPEEGSEDRQPKTARRDAVAVIAGPAVSPPSTPAPAAAPSQEFSTEPIWPNEAEDDACDVEMANVPAGDVTSDEDLPASKGGVA